MLELLRFALHFKAISRQKKIFMCWHDVSYTKYSLGVEHYRDHVVHKRDITSVAN